MYDCCRRRSLASAARLFMAVVLGGSMAAGFWSGTAGAAGRAGPTPNAATTCVVSSTLVNSCRPWLGAVAGGYPNLPTWKDQIIGHERRIGRTVDMVHSYHVAGAVTLTSDEVYFVNRGTILYVNWKPANRWVDAAGGNATVNGQIDQMARSIIAVKPHQVMIAVFGEPERFVTPGTSSCPGLKGNSGSPADYRAMWQNVRSRFAAAGADNVVWAINYLGYKGWDCLFPSLWPGNSMVDWIVWDPYVGPNERWDTLTGYFYDAMTAKSDATHDYLSKAWGLAEFGYWYGTNQAEAYRMYDEAKASLDSGRYPRLKLYEPFDTVASTGTDTRTNYTTKGVLDPVEQQHYKALASDPLLTDETQPPPPPPPPPPSGTDYLAGCDKSVESGMSCFSGSYNGVVYPVWQTADGHSGTHSVQVTNTTAGAATVGMNTRPAPVGSTTIGVTYTGTVWVKAGNVGANVRVSLRERRAEGTAPGYTLATWTATDTTWHAMTATYTAKENGNTLTFSAYSTGVAPGQWFRCDDFTLTSP